MPSVGAVGDFFDGACAQGDFVAVGGDDFDLALAIGVGDGVGTGVGCAQGVGVGAGASEQLIASVATVQGVIARIAFEVVSSAFAAEGVVAASTVEVIAYLAVGANDCIGTIITEGDFLNGSIRVIRFAL